MAEKIGSYLSPIEVEKGKAKIKGNATIDGNATIKGNATIEGVLESEKLSLSDLNAAPASADAEGAKGEIRVTADAIYVCIDTDTWVKADLATWT